MPIKAHYKVEIEVVHLPDTKKYSPNSPNETVQKTACIQEFGKCATLSLKSVVSVNGGIERWMTSGITPRALGVEQWGRRRELF